MEHLLDNAVVALAYFTVGFGGMALITGIMYVAVPSIREEIKADFRR